jgi:hypothetical protein
MYADTCPRTKSGNVRGLSKNCTQTNYLSADSVCCPKVWECPRTVEELYADNLSVRGQCLLSASYDEKQQTKSVGLNVFSYSQRTPTSFNVSVFTCRILPVIVWSNERVLTFIENLQSSACLWDVHCADYKNRNKKGDAMDFLAKKNMKSALLKLRKNRQSQRSVSDRT